MTSKIYYIKARLYPTVITAIPFFMFSYHLITQVNSDMPNNVRLIVLFVGQFIPDAAFLFLSTQINRFISKEFFHRFIFKGNAKLPAVNYLLLQNDFYPLMQKMSIRQAISTELKVPLPGFLEEVAHGSGARHRISCAVYKLKNLLRGNSIVLQHDIEYKFIRNLIGGSLHAIIFSAINIYMGYIHADFLFIKLGFISLIFYYWLLLFSKILLTRYSGYYARVLYQEFMSTK